MEKRKQFIINFLYFAIILIAVFLFIKFGLPLLMPFVIAFLIAYFLKRPIRFVSSKLKLPQKLIAILFVILFYGTVGLFVSLISVKAFSSIRVFAQNLPQLFSTYAYPLLADIFDDLEHAIIQMDPTLLGALDYLWTQLVQSLGQLVSSLSVNSMQLISGFASSLPMFFIKMVLMIISTFFITADYDRLTEFCLCQLNERAKNVFLQIKQYVVGTLFVCIRSYALIMSITFVELSIGLTIIGIEYSIPIAFFIAVFDILPVLGTGGIMIPWSILTLLQGDFAMALKLFIVYVIITIIRNILEPKIVGSQIGLHPVVTLISLFVGAQLLGIIGLFGLPITLSLLRHLNDTGTIQIFKKPADPADSLAIQEYSANKPCGS